MKDQKPQNLIVKNAQLMGGPYKNFSGQASAKTPNGARSFCIILDEETAAALIEEGWNVKTTNPTNDRYEPTLYLKVHVSYAYGEPDIEVFDSEARSNGTFFNEKMIGKLDKARIKTVDVNISPSSKKYDHPDGSAPTYAAYLESMNVIIDKDPIAAMRDDGFDEEE